jgi:dihydroneopterin aldolase
MKRAIIKLGGSTASASEMDVWISALAGSALPLVIVPGGGPFADQVREAQERMGFSDAAAHAMAILAMDQFGHVILDRDERLTSARTLDDMRRTLEGASVPVWLPSAVTIPASDIPVSWDITSDSLAAWLAGKIGADALLLIKQTAAFRDADCIDSLTAAGIVDAGLSAMLPAGVDLYLAGPPDATTAGEMLASGALPGNRVARAASMGRKAG